MILPMFAMLMLTLAIAILAVIVRIKSVTSSVVKISYYRVMQGQDVPDMVTRSTRCFNNQFEVPILFYIVSTLFVALNIASILAIILAWCFVLMRILQTVIHLTYNNVIHRMLCFWTGFLVVLAMWALLLVETA